MKLIILCLLSLSPGDPEPTDFAFMRAVEGFVIDTIPRPVRIGDHAPKAVADKIALLDADCFGCRDRARSDLVAMGGDSARWLFWGVRSKQASIRYNCWSILRQIGSCRYCYGSGICKSFVMSSAAYGCVGCGTGESYHDNPDIDRQCQRCRTNPGYLDMADLHF